MLGKCEKGGRRVVGGDKRDCCLSGTAVALRARSAAILARSILVSYLVAFAHILLVGNAQSQEWPQKPVVIVVPFAAGGNTDGIARIIGHELGEALGQQFIVENRPGAGGAIAAEVVARAAPDG